MSVKKTVTFAEETKNKMRAKETEKEVKEDPEKKFEEGFKEWKRANKLQLPVQIINDELRDCGFFKPISEEIMEPSVHYKQGEGEGWESDCDGWFD
jgi:hypothetical protein